jgi:hypothetical protein
MTDDHEGDTTMATKEQTITALTTPANGWNFTPHSSTTMLRRPLFASGDTFEFAGAGDNLTLRVTDGDGRLVFGKDLLLGWDVVTNAFTVTAYGRHMELRATPANTEFGWSMGYQAEYEACPHQSPDEGGDGDPK